MPGRLRKSRSRPSPTLWKLSQFTKRWSGLPKDLHALPSWSSCATFSAARWPRLHQSSVSPTPLPKRSGPSPVHGSGESGFAAKKYPNPSRNPRGVLLPFSHSLHGETQ